MSIHPSVVVFGEAHLHVGAHSRIDCFRVITAGPEDVTIGEHVHIGAGCFVSGGGGLVLPRARRTPTSRRVLVPRERRRLATFREVPNLPNSVGQGSIAFRCRLRVLKRPTAGGVAALRSGGGVSCHNRWRLPAPETRHGRSRNSLQTPAQLTRAEPNACKSPT